MSEAPFSSRKAPRAEGRTSAGWDDAKKAELCAAHMAMAAWTLEIGG